VNGGWDIVAAFSSATVPSLMSSLKSWLPGAVVGDNLTISAMRYNIHLAWSAIGGLAVALIFLQRGKTARRTGVVLLLYAALDHAALNYTLLGNSGLVSLVAAPFNALRSFLWLMPIAALGAASWLDGPRQRGASARELLLTTEQQSTPRFIGALRAAAVRLPLSLFWVDSLFRLRRAYATAVNARLSSVDGLREFILNFRDRIDRVVAGPERVAVLPMDRIGPTFLKLLRQRKVIIWLALMLPSAGWLVVGGFPQTVWLQRLLTTGAAWVAIRALAFPALIRMAWQVVRGLRGWRQTNTAHVGDVPAEVMLRLISGTGAFFFGAYALFLTVSGQSPDSHVLDNFHVMEAIASATIVGLLLTALAGLVMFSPVAPVFGEMAWSTAGAEILAADSIESEVVAAGFGSLGEGAAEAGGEISFAEAFEQEVPFQDYRSVDDLGRASGIRTVITPETLLGGSEPNPGIAPPGWSGGQFGEARAHLLGAQLGGSGALEENLVTFYQQANLQMLKFENQIRLAVEGGEVVSYSATPIYQGAGQVPTAIQLEAVGSRGLKLFVSIRNIVLPA